MEMYYNLDDKKEDLVDDISKLNLDIIKKSPAIACIISKEEIVDSKIDDLDTILKLSLCNKDIFKDKFIISISGYDKHKNLWEIEDVQNYFKNLFAIHPYMFYFLKRHQCSNSRSLIFFCLNCKAVFVDKNITKINKANLDEDFKQNVIRGANMLNLNNEEIKKYFIEILSVQ